MIADLLPTRLMWVGFRGVARLNGRTVPLTRRPQLPGLKLDAIDFVPGELAMVMPERAGWRNMEPGEIDAATTLLARIVAAGGQEPAEC